MFTPEELESMNFFPRPAVLSDRQGRHQPEVCMGEGQFTVGEFYPTRELAMMRAKEESDILLEKLRQVNKTWAAQFKLAKG